MPRSPADSSIRQKATDNDLEILYRSAGAGQCAGDCHRLIGAVALCTLPVAQYPNVVPPTVPVTTRYPGASAATVMNTVALPIEQQVNGVQGMLYMQSTSASDGTYTLTVTFAIGTDLNFAQVLVQNRVSAALASLPQAVQVQGVTCSKNPRRSWRSSR